MTGAPTISADSLQRLRKFEANGRWANAHDAELQQHEGKYVAIDDQRLLDVADSGPELRKKFAGREAVFIMFVSPPDLAWML